MSKVKDAVIQMMGVTLSGTLQKLGPMPDDIGEAVRAILDGDDLSALLALGCHLDDTRKAGSYDLLAEGLLSIQNSKLA